MEKLNAVITGLGAYVPESVLTNDDLSKMVDTNDEWIMTRVGIKTRHILKEPGLGSSYMGWKACEQLFSRTQVTPDDIDLLICGTTTADYHFPSTGALLCDKLGLTNAFAFDLEAACSGFIYGLEVGANFIRSGRYKKVVVVVAEKLSSMVDYTDRSTCPLFGDGAAAALLEPTTEEIGVIDSYLRTDGKGYPFLHMEAGGSVTPSTHETIDARKHYIFQDGRPVFKHAVVDMADACEAVMQRNGLTKEDVTWVIPHQANMRIIEAVANRLEVPMDKVLVNIQEYGNTSGVTIPLCLWNYEDRLKKGDNLILTAFGAGFSWGAVYLKWGYDGKQA